MKREFFISVIILIFLSFPVFAGNFGTNDLITVPTADILPETYLDLSYQSILGEESEDIISSNYCFREGVQVGGRLKWFPQEEEVEFYPGLKVNLFEEAGNYQPMVSIGVDDRNLYLVASKTLSSYSVRTHAGVGNKELFSDYVFLGVNKVLNPVVVSTGENSFKIPTINVQLEYNGGINLGTELKFDSGVEVDIGVIDFDKFNLGIGFRNEF